MDERIEFTLNGEHRVLSRADVERCGAVLEPRTIQKYAVRVAGKMFPVRQIFGAATGIDGDEFTSQTARRHLAALGLEIHTSSTAPSGDRARGLRTSGRAPEPPRAVDDTWHTEASVQAAVVTWLVNQGWQILSVANTATREHGIDIVASRGSETIGVEVKGFPSRTYADPARAGETKRTQPSTQAGHWFGQAVLAAMRLRGRQPEVASVIALPRFPRYEALYRETQGSLGAAGITVWWVTEAGAVEAAHD